MYMMMNDENVDLIMMKGYADVLMRMDEDGEGMMIMLVDGTIGILCIKCALLGSEGCDIFQKFCRKCTFLMGAWCLWSDRARLWSD